MAKKYILTGGPGSGKTSILLSLGKKGEYIIKEAAEDTIKFYRSKGIDNPWDYEDFQTEILNLQIQREKDIPDGIERVFIDRGIPDGLAYSNPKSKIYEKTLIEANKTRYEKIFVIESLGFLENTIIRREDSKKAIEIGLRLQDIYTDLGYNIIKIPAFPLEKRVELILEIISNSTRCNKGRNKNGERR